MGDVQVFGIVMSPGSFIAFVGEIAVACILAAAVIMAARHKGRYHHYMILTAFLTDELVLKPLMFQRLSLGVFGDFPYSGTFAPLHISLAIVTTVLGLAAVIVGFKYRVKKEKKLFMPPKGMRWHKPVGILYVAIWYLAFIDGIYIFSRFYL